MSKSGKKPLKKPTKKAEKEEAQKAAFQEAERLKAKRKAYQEERMQKYQEDYNEVFDVLKKITISNQVYSGIYRYHGFMFQLEYLAAKATFFSFVPKSIKSGIKIPESVESLKKSVEELIIFLCGDVDLKYYQYEIDLEVLNTIVKDFEFVIDIEN